MFQDKTIKARRRGPIHALATTTLQRPARRIVILVCASVAVLLLLNGAHLYSPRPLLALPSLSPPPSSSSSSLSSVPPSSPRTRPSDFERALAGLFSSLPSEDERRQLLEPITAQREQRLHELAVRARRYKTLFDAWEELHVVVQENGDSYVRDDVIQRLRRAYRSGRGSPFTGNLSETGLVDAIQSYETSRIFTTRLATLLFPWTSPYFSDHAALHSHMRQGGRGIVTTAGDKQAEFLLAGIPMLRELGCMLPIEVMYFGDSDLNADYRTRLGGFDGVVLRDVSQMVDKTMGEMTGYAAKPVSILLSSFRDVLFFDADCSFFQNPESLFDGPDYQETGALFFKDRRYIPHSRKKWLQEIMPKPYSEKLMRSWFWTGESAYEQESGLMYVDKWRHFVALLLTTRLNGPERTTDGGGAGIYGMVHGDKETFWLGWEFVGDVDYSFHVGAVGNMGVATAMPGNNEGLEPGGQPRSGRCHICAQQLLHLDVDGKPLWNNGWVLRDKSQPKEQWRLMTFVDFASEPAAAEGHAWEMGTELSDTCLVRPCNQTHKLTPEMMAPLTALQLRAKQVRASLGGSLDAPAADEA